MLLLTERHTVGTLVLGGVTFVGTDHDAVQGAEVFIFTMMGTLVYSTLDGLVGVTVHNVFLLFVEFGYSMFLPMNIIPENPSAIAF